MVCAGQSEEQWRELRLQAPEHLHTADCDRARGGDRGAGGDTDAAKLLDGIGERLGRETGIAKGRKLTSYKSIKTDVINAGAKWEDREAVTDQGVVTWRHPGDLEAFFAEVMEEIAESRHAQRSAA